MPKNRTPQLMHLHEIHLHVLRAIEEDSGLTQRQLVSVLRVGLGKAHYCMKALVEKGLVKIDNFSHNQHTLGYAYLLTPNGMKHKSELTRHFFRAQGIRVPTVKG
jgi:EPS-associated MarR family transcriptional regulator